MKERRKQMMKRLVIEELERRTMLDGTDIAMAATGLTTNSYQDFYKAQVGTEIGGDAGVGMLDQPLLAPRYGQLRTIAGANLTPNAAASSPEANTGLGQMTITTGANTLGISSFAYPTAGPSRAGGTGNAALGIGSGAISPSAVDQAIDELSLELPSLVAGQSIKKPESRKPVETAAEKQDEQVRETRQHRSAEDRAMELMALLER
jgi:hypothetical protein